MPARLIITNGDAAVARLREAGIEAEFLPWRDPLHDGPAPAGLVLEALSLIRAQFLARELGHSLIDVMQQFAARDASARNHHQFERVDLWFEHDLYDQLQLIQLLNFFAAENRLEGVFLIEAADYLATEPVTSLRGLGAAAAPVNAARMETGRRAWAAFTASSPEKLGEFAATEGRALPHLAPALRRLIRELPAIASGLSLTEERVLNVLSAGQQTVHQLFTKIQAQEEARFLGDILFFRRLDRLAFAPQPLIAGLEFESTRCARGANAPDYRAYAEARVRLTDIGRAALAGRFDHAAENGIDRWLGGTHVTPKTMWRRDQHGRLAMPPKGQPNPSHDSPARA
ncbi:MAG TPA: hypothetical protein VHG27_06210 [Xanthobacteraceae bacterium]|nr:hypothetical protein [Xanthobacteraceae bacterium]